MSGERLANYQLHAVEEAGFRVGRTGCVYERSFMNDIKKREDVVILTDLLRQHNEWFINQLSATVRSLWNALSEFTKAYLLARAGDAIFLGEEVANATFPELRGYEGIMDSLRGLYRHKEQIEEEKWIKEQKERIDGECERKVAEITVPVPVNVVDRVLTREERRQVRSVLENKFIENAPVTAMIKVVKEFAGFCERLSIPENHIKVPTGQYIEREVPSRQEADMVNEAARVLSSVDRYTAYVRLEKREGEAGAWRGKVRMEKLVAVPADALAAAQNAIEAYVRRYTRPREEIRREIEERRRLIRVQAACGRTEAERQAPPPPQKSGSGPEEEPPPPARRRLVRSSGEAREEEA